MRSTEQGAGGAARSAPRWADVKPLLHFAPPALSRASKVENALTISDLRRIGRRCTPRAVFDYVDGGSESELTMARSRAAFGAVEFRPRVLRDVSEVSTEVEIFGRRRAMPLILAPTGMTRIVHRGGELAVAAAAAGANVPYTLSTMATTSIEAIRELNGNADLWFQLYMWRDRAATRKLIERAAESGYSTLVVTVDVPTGGFRTRDLRNGFSIPPRLGVRTMADMALHPTWWFDFLTGGPLTFGSFDQPPSGIAETAARMFDSSTTFEDLTWVREQWPGSLLVKGVQRADDAVHAVEAGADGVIISNHGGRQLDRSVASLTLLPAVRDAVPQSAAVFIDGGVRGGADVAAAVGMGATAVLVGRAYLYGLMAGGQRGVERMLEIMHADLVRTMRLCGASTIVELSAALQE